MKTLILILFLACLHLSNPNRGAAQDWPQWRGVNRDAKAVGFTPPKTWPDALKRVWNKPVGDGVATPSLVGDRLYVFARQEGKEILRCLEAADGKELWSNGYDALGASGPASSFSGPRCSPTVAEGKVVTLGVRGVLSCYDAAQGTLLWRKDDFKGATPRFFTSSCPVVADGICVAQLGSEQNGGMVAYDLASGEEKWRWAGDGPAYASPALLTVDNTNYVVAETGRKLVVISLRDGNLAWEAPFAVQGRGYNAATPIVEGATIIYTGSGRGATAVRFSGGEGKLTATELWKNPDNSVQFNTPTFKDGYIYGLSARNDLFCLNAGDGKTAWTASSASASTQGEGQGEGERRGRTRGAAGYGSIVDAGSVMLALTPASELIVFSPESQAYTEVARIKVADSPTYAYPVVSGNRIFVKDQDSLTLWTVQ